jgi:hypothetical protein
MVAAGALYAVIRKRIPDHFPEKPEISIRKDVHALVFGGPSTD